MELFWIWFAANIGILGVVYGAQYLAGKGLNLWQSLFVGLLATAVLKLVRWLNFLWPFARRRSQMLKLSLNCKGSERG